MKIAKQQPVAGSRLIGCASAKTYRPMRQGLNLSPRAAVKLSARAADEPPGECHDSKAGAAGTDSGSMSDPEPQMDAREIPPAQIEHDREKYLQQMTLPPGNAGVGL